MSEEPTKTAEQAEAPRRPSMFRSVPGSVKTLRQLYKDRLNLPDKAAMQAELAGESDRSSVILMASLLDDGLVLLLAEALCFRPTEDEFERVFRFEGPLGSFSARLEVAFIFGFIEDADSDGSRPPIPI
jgi:hypothetical protein